MDKPIVSDDRLYELCGALPLGREPRTEERIAICRELFSHRSRVSGGAVAVTDEMARAFIAKHREIWPGGGWPTLDTAKELLTAALAHPEGKREPVPSDDDVMRVVRMAYNDGFSEGTREHTSRGGRPWSEARPAYEREVYALYASSPTPGGQDG